MVDGLHFVRPIKAERAPGAEPGRVLLRLFDRVRWRMAVLNQSASLSAEAERDFAAALELVESSEGLSRGHEAS